MSSSNRRRRGGHGGGEHEESSERWLLTYADMITLLLALFIVLWSISSVNTSKFAALSTSLTQAFSGKVTQGGGGILSGGTAILQPQGTQVENIEAASSSSSSFPNPNSISQTIANSINTSMAQSEQKSLEHVQQQVKDAAKKDGLSRLIHTQVEERGLVIRLLTDKVLFGSGQATLGSEAAPLIERIGRILAKNTNPIRVEGNTDNEPISTAEFPSNWELSAARATAVLEHLIDGGVSPADLSVAGYGSEKPIASNATDAGRRHNRHVDIVVLRNGQTPDSTDSTPTTHINLGA